MEEPDSTVALAADLTIAWLSNSGTRASADDALAFLRSMHEAVNALSNATPEAEVEPATDFTPATTARKSLANPDHIISMIDGKPYRTLRRHLSTNGLTPEEYRERYNLKPDYPMVAPSYSEARRQMAYKIGLGSKGRAARAKVDQTSPKAARKPRSPKAERVLSV